MKINRSKVVIYLNVANEYLPSERGEIYMWCWWLLVLLLVEDNGCCQNNCRTNDCCCNTFIINGNKKCHKKCPKKCC